MEKGNFKTLNMLETINLIKKETLADKNGKNETNRCEC